MHPLLKSAVRSITVHEADDAPFPAIVQYPTTQSSSGGTTIGPYHFDATPDAPPEAAPFPLCVVSHGGGGSHLLYRSIATHLAASGFVVVCPEHPGDNRNDRSQSNTDAAALHRPRHASRAIDAVLADAILGPIVDAKRIGVIGHSMGGYTALALAGGHPWSRSGVPLSVQADARVRAAVLLAPSTGWFLAPGALADVVVPLLVLVGEYDDVTPPDDVGRAMRGLPAATPMTFEVIAGAGHFAFLTPFPPHMRRPDFPPARDPEGFDRERFHATLPGRIEEFLTHALASPGT